MTKNKFFAIKRVFLKLDLGNKESFKYYCHIVQVTNIILHKITKVKSNLKDEIYGKKCRKMRKNTYFRKRCTF